MTPDLALRAAKDRIATAMIGSDAALDPRIGELVMRPHQRVAVVRIMRLLGRHRGALLADAVGLGKTYVALAVAREHRAPVVVCPAALRGMWERAMRIAGMSLPIQSIEGLGRGERLSLAPDLVVVDEAHHFRNPRTQRYETIARWSHHARILLLSATPLHNSRRDLVSVLALFLGSKVNAWSDAELSSVIVRRTEEAMEQPLPELVGPHSLTPGDDDAFLDALCALPLPVPAADEGLASALTTISLVHLWSSSRAALVESLRLRRARAIAMIDALDAGHLPTKEELTRWHFADGVQQLPFPFFESASSPDVPRLELKERLNRYIEAIGSVIAMDHVIPDPDLRRAELLRNVRAAHPRERIVAFSQYARTVTALGRLMRRDRGIAVIHGESASIAVGATSRAEILEQFTLDAAPPPPTRRIDLLLTTDLMSEGVDLRAASVIVHLDLPWNPARLEQRIGRARRMGSPYREIHAYAFVPPAPADRMLRLRDRLQAKISIALEVLGNGMGLGTGEDYSPVAEAELLRSRLARWVDPTARSDDAVPLTAAGFGVQSAWLALVSMRGIPTLVHGRTGRIGEDARESMTIIDEIEGACSLCEASLREATSELDRWIAARESVSDLRAERSYPPAKRAVLDRLATAVARAPRHRRSRVLSAATRVRAGIVALDGIGAERVLAELACAAVDDEAWMQSLETFETLHTSAASLAPPFRVEALIVIVPRQASVNGSSEAAAAQP